MLEARNTCSASARARAEISASAGLDPHNAFAAFERFVMSLQYFHRMMSTRGMLWNAAVLIDVAME